MKLWLGGAGLILMALAAAFGPGLWPEDPRSIHLARSLLPPGPECPLGCDSNGTDILAILLHGARLSLFVGGVTTAACTAIALLLGSFAAWSGGRRDASVRWLLDVVFAFPGILLAIALASMMGPSLGNVVLCLVLTGWAGLTRIVRGEVMSIRHREFVEAARALGLSTPRILVFHVWPNLLPTVFVASTFGFASVVVSEASLSFLGVGIPAGTPSWGALLSSGKSFLLEAPHIAAAPGVALMFTVLALNLLGEGLREWLDARVAGGSYLHQRLRDGDTFSIGLIEFRVMHTPGHTPEHI
ncbi:MAG: ABC transporter permease subunit, partial [Bdellovibrionales bacterium]|nr:ABC transporter permease subunit [Bdellovibrionales bacterium]